MHLGKEQRPNGRQLMDGGGSHSQFSGIYLQPGSRLTTSSGFFHYYGGIHMHLQQGSFSKKYGDALDGTLGDMDLGGSLQRGKVDDTFKKKKSSKTSGHSRRENKKRQPSQAAHGHSPRVTP